MTPWERKQINNSLRAAWASSHETQVWEYYKNLPREERSKLGKLLDRPTISTLKRWVKFWEGKITFTDLDREYFEFVFKKIEDSKK